MKKKFVVFFLVATSLFCIYSCKEKSTAPVATEYTVEGIVDTTLNGSKMYLTDYNTKQKIDSVIIDNGKFTFEGIVDSVRYCRVDIGREYANFILEGGSISIDLKDHNASGTPLNKVLSDFVHQRDSILALPHSYRETLEKEIEDPDLLKAKLDSIYKNSWKPAYDKFYDSALDANTDNVIGMILARDISLSASTGKMDTVFSKLSEDIRNRVMVKRLIERNDAIKKTSVGQKFTDFTITQEDGTEMSLSDYAGKGKYLLVDFWASWCGPCRRETPHLKELYNKYKGDKFEILGVAVWDEIADTKKAIDEDKITWPQILGGKDIPTELYGIGSIPHIMLIGPDGEIIARNLRGDEMKSKIKEVMNQ